MEIKNCTATIMVVDDTPPSLILLDRFLKHEGCEVRLATRGDIALKDAHDGPPDLIPLDIDMPDMDSFEVWQHLKANEKSIISKK